MEEKYIKLGLKLTFIGRKIAYIVAVISLMMALYVDIKYNKIALSNIISSASILFFINLDNRNNSDYKKDVKVTNEIFNILIYITMAFLVIKYIITNFYL